MLFTQLTMFAERNRVLTPQDAGQPGHGIATERASDHLTILNSPFNDFAGKFACKFGIDFGDTCID